MGVGTWLPCCLSFSRVLVLSFCCELHTLLSCDLPTGPLSHLVRAQKPPFHVEEMAQAFPENVEWLLTHMLPSENSQG